MPDRRPHPFHDLQCDCSYCVPRVPTNLDEILAAIERQTCHLVAISNAIEWLKHGIRWQQSERFETDADCVSIHPDLSEPPLAEILAKMRENYGMRSPTMEEMAEKRDLAAASYFAEGRDVFAQEQECCRCHAPKGQACYGWCPREQAHAAEDEKWRTP